MSAAASVSQVLFPHVGEGKGIPYIHLSVFFFFFPVRRNLTIIVVLRMKFNDSATLRRTLTYLQRPNRSTLRDAAMIRYTVYTMEELRPPLYCYTSILQLLLLLMREMLALFERN